MAPQIPDQVTALKSFAELLSWAMAVWGDADGGLLPIVRRTATGATAEVTLTKGADEVQFDFGDLPTSVHAQWFLRVGLMVDRGVLTQVDPNSEKLPIHRKMEGYKSADSAKDWYWGTTLGSLYFGFFCNALRLPSEVRVYLRSRYTGFEFRKRPKRFATIEFDKARVHGAIEHSQEFLAAHPPTNSPSTRADGPSVATPTPDEPETHLTPPPTSRLYVSLGGTPKRAVVSTKGPVLGVRGTNAIVATSGTALAVQDGAQLQVSRLNRVSGRVALWNRPLDLTKLLDGQVLAVDSCGPADIVFVWASDAETAIYRGGKEDGSVELIDRLDNRRASAAVLHGVRALLSFPDSPAGDGACEAFPELIGTSVVGAASNGRLVVLAVGTDHDGQESAWIEVDGRHRQIVPADASLELPLGTRSFPILRGVDGTVIEVSPQPTSAQPYEHWGSPFLIGQAASA